MPPDLLQSFVDEGHELVDAIEQGLVELERELGADQQETIHALFRAAHTLKGNAAMAGLEGYVGFTHVLEHVLSRVREGSLPTASVVEALLGAVDVLRAMLGAVEERRSERAVEGYDDALARLQGLLGEEGEPRPVEMLGGPVRALAYVLTLTCAPEQRVEEAAALRLELDVFGPITSVEPAWESGAERYAIVQTTDARRADVEAAVMFGGGEVTFPAPALVTQAAPALVAQAAPALVAQAAPVTPVTPAAGAARTARRATTQVLKIDSERLDAIVDLVGELTIALARSRALQRDAAADLAAKNDAMDALEVYARDVQERVMALRMVPVRDTFEKFRRPVRDVARDLGREVVFETEGAETELDRKLLDALADPLKHMVRNAVAHGIEAPEERERAGKPRAGRLVLRAMQREGAAILEIEDDGGGIDLARVLAKGIAKGLVAPGATPTDAQIYELLFAAGFSTAEVVNEVAGRGVGLDVVKQGVASLRGTIQVHSKLGAGTVFRIRLPMTLAIVDGLNVHVGEETLTIPLSSVVELLDAGERPRQTLEGKHAFLDLRGASVPLVRTADVLGFASGAAHASGAAGADPDAGIVVVLQSDDRRFGILVDAVLGTSRAVLKPLERAYSLFKKLDGRFVRPGGLAGATVLGDGSIGLVLDVAGFETMAFGG